MEDHTSFGHFLSLGAFSANLWRWLRCGENPSRSANPPAYPLTFSFTATLKMHDSKNPVVFFCMQDYSMSSRNVFTVRISKGNLASIELRPQLRPQLPSTPLSPPSTPPLNLSPRRDLMLLYFRSARRWSCDVAAPHLPSAASAFSGPN